MSWKIDPYKRLEALVPGLKKWMMLHDALSLIATRLERLNKVRRTIKKRSKK